MDENARENKEWEYIVQVKTSAGHTFTSLAHAISENSGVADDLGTLLTDLFKEIDESIKDGRDYKFNMYLLDHSTHSSESIYRGNLRICEYISGENMCQWDCGNEGSPMIYMGDSVIYCGECQEE